MLRCSLAPIDAVEIPSFENISEKRQIFILEKVILIKNRWNFQGAPTGPLKFLKFGLLDIHT